MLVSEIVMMVMFTFGFFCFLQAVSGVRRKQAIIYLLVGTPFLVGSLVWADMTKGIRSEERLVLEAAERKREKAAAKAKAQAATEATALKTSTVEVSGKASTATRQEPPEKEPKAIP